MVQEFGYIRVKWLNLCKNITILIYFLLLHLSIHCHFDILTKHGIKQIMCLLINVTIDCIITPYFIVVAQEIGDHNPWTCNICNELVNTSYLCRP